MTKLSEFTFIPRGEAKLVQTPTFIEGELADVISQEYKAEKAKLNNNPNFKLKKEGRAVTGSNIFDSALIDKIVSPYGLRTALPQDLTQEVLDMVKNKHYVDTNALVLRSLNDGVYPANNSLARTLAEKVDYQESKGPVLVTSLTVESFPEDENYGLKLTPLDKSKIIYDDRLLGKYNGWKFNTIDEIGLPKGLDKNKGLRTWYTKNDGLSGLVLNWYLDLYSYTDWGRLDDSDSAGRVVLVSAEGTTQKFSDILSQARKSKLLKKFSEAKDYLDSIITEIEKE